MRTLFLLSLLLLNYHSQAQEFESYENGLIYDQSTMQQLGHIVDSLHLKHKTCEQFPSFQSHTQGKASYITLKITNDNKASILQDLEQGISLAAFQKKYSPKIEADCYLVQEHYTNRAGKQMLSFYDVNSSGWYSNGIIIDNNLEDVEDLASTHWVYDKKALQDERSSFEAFYLPNGLHSIALPEHYAQLVAYVDCLMDPNIKKLTPPLSEDKDDFWMGLPQNWQQLPKKEQKALLDTLRGMRVVGFCSQDSRPREHAVAIATVAAHAVQWEVFLRAHLDVLNDRFDRMSDGSYAFAQRQTYLKELEALDINSSDLLLGIMLRVEHPDPHHYWGNVGRLGRALAESKHRDSTLKRLLEMIKDPELDLFNRRIAANFYFSYLYHLPKNTPGLKTNLQAAKEAFQSLPTCVKEGLTFEHWKK